MTTPPTNGASDPTADRFELYARTRDRALRDELVLGHLPLVEKIARRYSNLGEPIEDLVQDGYIGLIKAVDQFNPQMGIKFTTYATHVVAGEIRHYLRDLGRLIKEPAWLVELRFRVNRTAEELTQRLGRVPSITEIAEQLNLPEEDVAEVIATRAVFQVTSLDDSGSTENEDQEGSSSLAERIMDSRSDFTATFEERAALRQALSKLRKLERVVIHQFFYREHTKTEIARHLDISINYVSYLITRGLQNLRQILLKEDRREAVARLEYMQSRLALQEGEFDKSNIVDPVTGLYLKPFFVTLIEDEIARSTRYGLEFSLLFFVFRGWTDLVENISEAEKDSLLRSFASMLRRGLRDVDRLSYYGQGRFAAILPHTGKNAHVAFDRIRTWAKGRTWLSKQLRTIGPLHLMGKVIAFPKDGKTAQALLEIGEQIDRRARTNPDERT